ncbi:hypothetical protein E2C01_026739 [Portunus trituberculatus]|uniref:Uncharacterized protein n=1 Tax=Portunus trituberculatus TaxID=210409 RepID=A0A5B7EGB7_PORTR|nr:hypothetical protein [Portunus trituberculatus]
MALKQQGLLRQDGVRDCATSTAEKLVIATVEHSTVGTRGEKHCTAEPPDLRKRDEKQSENMESAGKNRKKRSEGSRYSGRGK